MYFDRLLHLPLKQDMSFFLFGPRGAGKTSWLKSHFSDSIYIDLLHDETFNQLQLNPSRLENLIPNNYKAWVIIDEVQRIPALLNEVHRLIEARGIKFILTGSSARKLKQTGVNLLAGRALTYHLYPLSKVELKDTFSFDKALNYGCLPMVYQVSDPNAYLQAYMRTYIKEEVQQEALVRQQASFNKFLEVASFSQGSMVNYSAVAREVGVNRKTVETYFDILEDLLIAYRVYPFSKRAKRNLVKHAKFYYFDVGLYRIIRPSGPFDRSEEIDGMALETLFYQEALALNSYYNTGYTIYFWRTQAGHEVDFVLYGKEKIYAFEIKRTSSLTSKHFKNLRLFKEDYAIAECYLVYGGQHAEYHDGITALPFVKALDKLKEIFNL